jgi:eukaryotic-like serine/threonine-protein kinase
MYWLPTIRAAAELGRGHPQKALEFLEPSAPYELGLVEEGALTPAYVRGLVYLALRNGELAEKEFQKIMNHPGLVLNSCIGPLGRLGLARAYALQGDRTKARNAYIDFLKLWKDADPDIPILKQAKAEYARLQ